MLLPSGFQGSVFDGMTKVLKLCHLTSRRLFIYIKAIVLIVLWIVVILCLTSYSGMDSLFLIVKEMGKDQWHLQRSMSCSNIKFSPRVAKPRKHFELIWKDRFQSNEVLHFQENYLLTCSSRNTSIAVVASSGRSASPGWGLGSITNFALTVFFLADHPSVTRRFYLYVNNWNYVSWLALFQDFAAKECPIVQEMDDLEFNKKSLGAGAEYPVTFADAKKITVSGAHPVVEQNGPGWENFFDGIALFETTVGVDEIFRKRSILARSFLSPNPTLFNAIKILWTQMTNAGKSGYSAIHVRRSDKLKQEAHSFPVVLYFRSLRRLCHLHNGTCPKIVFIWCDSQEFCEEFRGLANGCFQVTTFQEEVKKANLLPWSKAHHLDFKSQDEFNHQPADFRLQNAQELVISLFLSVLSDFFLCTYSSNICRLAAILRASNLLENDVVSLDFERWTTL